MPAGLQGTSVQHTYKFNLPALNSTNYLTLPPFANIIFTTTKRKTIMLSYEPTLQEYAVNEQVYLQQHPKYDVLCTGVVVFDKDGKLLIVQRAADEKAFPNMWVSIDPTLARCVCLLRTSNKSQEIPGGKVDDTDETLLHAAVRELKEETGLTATRVRRKVAELTFEDGRPGRKPVTWLKLIFEMEVENTNVALDPVEHQQYLFASEDEIVEDLVGGVRLAYISPPNKQVKLDAFRQQKEAILS
jgi:8-oxo-dGTP pyrophosphatase MutT (NUDIX family)